VGKLPPSVSVSTGTPQAPRLKNPEEISHSGLTKSGETKTETKADAKAPAKADSVSKPPLEATSAGTEARGRGTDDFEPSQIGAPLKADLPVIPPSPGKKPRSGVLELLDQAEEPGVFFREKEHGEGEAGDEENDDLEQAVEEAIRLLFGVRGIHHIGPGEDVEGKPVVLISANQGFSNTSLERIPPLVNGFKTLVALPYELLPLRRER
jgi:hypothetical protein